MTSRVSLAVTSLVVGLLVTCEPSPAPVAVPTPATPEWVVSDSGALRLGEQGGETASDFGSVVGAGELANGTIWVADRQSSSVKFFTRDGAFISQVGRTGEGPGEFSEIWSVHHAGGDSVAVFDAGTRRITWVKPDGASEPVAFSDMRGVHPELLGPLNDGVVIQMRRTNDATTTAGLVRDSVAFIRFRNGVALDTVATVADSERHLVVDNGGRTRIRTSRILGRTLYAAAGPDRFAIGSSDSIAIRVYASTGELITTIRHDISTRAVTDEDRQAWLDASYEPRNGDREREFAKARAAYPAAERMPVFSQLHFDATGNLWVGEFTHPRRAPRRFLVFDHGGTLIATAQLPPMDTILSITADAVIGLTRDPDDVPVVTRYPTTTNISIISRKSADPRPSKP